MTDHNPDAHTASLALLAPLVDRIRADRVRLAVGGVGALALVVIATQGLLGGVVGRGISAVGSANSALLTAAAACFAGALVANAGAWRTTLAACGGRCDLVGACARYGVGSLVNTFAPARLGDAARVALFSGTLPQRGNRVLTAGGALASICVMRTFVQAALFATAAAIGALPIWPVLVLGGLAAIGMGTALVFRDRVPRHRFAHGLDALRALARSPRRAAQLLAWTTSAVALRVLAAATITAALGVHWSLGTALIITAVLDLAVAIPLTPGNLGIASGAVALALESRGVPLATAVAAGIAFHAVETAAGLAFGGGGVLVLAPFRSPGARRWTLRLACAAGAAVVVAGIGASVFPEFV